MRHRYIVKKRQDSLCDFIKVCCIGCIKFTTKFREKGFYFLQGAHDAWSGWVCVLLVGLAAGCFAGVIDIGASWMADLKFGICPQAFWFNREQCCWSSKETTFEVGNCSQVCKLISFM